jgi:hypothetical protein
MNYRKPFKVILLLASFVVASSCQTTLQAGPTAPAEPTRTFPSPDGMESPAQPAETQKVDLPLVVNQPATVSQEPAPEPTASVEQPVIPIPLAGPLTNPEAEISGLAWYREDLVLLPQYPQRMSEAGQPGQVFLLPASSILAFLDGESDEPLVPRAVSFLSPDLDELIPDFEGFEGIAFAGQRVFLTIESGGLGPMMSYLIAGRFAPDTGSIQLEASTLSPIPPQSGLINRGEEALVALGDHLLTIYETNGTEITPDPLAHRFRLDTLEMDTVPFPQIEYRITDASNSDEEGRFWVLNVFFPADVAILPLIDPIAEYFGRGPTHESQLSVERLLEFEATPNGVALTGRPPVQLELGDALEFRNWEGLAILPGRGFLLATDRYPETLLAFVPLP